MSDETIAVTGATGRIGGMVARHLAEAGRELVLLVRDPSRAPTLPGASVHRASFTDRDAARAALQGVGTVFMVSGAEAADRVDQHRAFIDAVVESDARHLVYLSFFGAAPEATFTLARDHWATEKYIRSTGIPFTFLRDNLYADFMPGMVGEDGVIRGPAGDGRAALVAQADIAEAAATVLKGPADHAGVTYDLTGPASLTFAEVAATLTEATGKPVTYQPETIDEAYASRERYGAPSWQLDAWVSTYTAVAKGELDGVTDHVETLTGHPATPLATVVR